MVQHKAGFQAFPADIFSCGLQKRARACTDGSGFTGAFTFVAHKHPRLNVGEYKQTPFIRQSDSARSAEHNEETRIRRASKSHKSTCYAGNYRAPDISRTVSSTVMQEYQVAASG